MRSEATLRIPSLRVVEPGEVTPEAARARAERSAARVRAALTLSIAALTTLGLVMVLSASSVKSFAEEGSSFVYFKRQLAYAGIGAVLALVASRIRYQIWQRLWVPMFGATLLLLLLVLVPAIGKQSGGSVRWIDLGFVWIQPSEMVKFAMVTAAASILAANLKHLYDPTRWAMPLLGLIALVMLLIMLQPDLGTATIVFVTVFMMVFVAGVRLRLLLFAGVASVIAGIGLIFLEGYRRARLFSFLDPWADPQNGGYQAVQSLIALGSGHLHGVGLGASRQKWYVPNAHTDFIFSILGEELGLIGEVVVLALFGVLMYAGVRVAMLAPDPFGRLLAGGITGWLGLQALVNLGAVTSLLPITGVPLPFMSFGGSSLIVSMMAGGVLWSIGRAAPASRRASAGRQGRREAGA